MQKLGVNAKASAKLQVCLCVCMLVHVHLRVCVHVRVHTHSNLPRHDAWSLIMLHLWCCDSLLPVMFEGGCHDSYTHDLQACVRAAENAQERAKAFEEVSRDQLRKAHHHEFLWYESCMQRIIMNCDRNGSLKRLVKWEERLVGFVSCSIWAWRANATTGGNMRCAWTSSSCQRDWTPAVPHGLRKDATRKVPCALYFMVCVCPRGCC
jgi:hypothetical protein